MLSLENTAILIVGLGFIAFLSGLKLYIQGSSSLKWIATQGVVVRSNLIKHKRVDRPETFEVNIEYKYTVKYKEYLSSRYSYRLPNANDFKENEKIIASFPSGHSCDVYYNPKNPEVSVLVRGYNNLSLLSLPIGALFILLGAIMYAQS